MSVFIPIILILLTFFLVRYVIPLLVRSILSRQNIIIDFTPNSLWSLSNLKIEQTRSQTKLFHFKTLDVKDISISWISLTKFIVRLDGISVTIILDSTKRSSTASNGPGSLPDIQFISQKLERFKVQLSRLASPFFQSLLGIVEVQLTTVVVNLDHNGETFLQTSIPNLNCNINALTISNLSDDESLQWMVQTGPNTSPTPSCMKLLQFTVRLSSAVISSPLPIQHIKGKSMFKIEGETVFKAGVLFSGDVGHVQPVVDFQTDCPTIVLDVFVSLLSHLKKEGIIVPSTVPNVSRDTIVMKEDLSQLDLMRIFQQRLKENFDAALVFTHLVTPFQPRCRLIFKSVGLTHTEYDNHALNNVIANLGQLKVIVGADINARKVSETVKYSNLFFTAEMTNSTVDFILQDKVHLAKIPAASLTSLKLQAIFSIPSSLSGQNKVDSSINVIAQSPRVIARTEVAHAVLSWIVQKLPTHQAATITTSKADKTTMPVSVHRTLVILHLIRSYAQFSLQASVMNAVLGIMTENDQLLGESKSYFSGIFARLESFQTELSSHSMEGNVLLQGARLFGLTLRTDGVFADEDLHTCPSLFEIEKVKIALNLTLSDLNDNLPVQSITLLDNLSVNIDVPAVLVDLSVLSKRNSMDYFFLSLRLRTWMSQIQQTFQVLQSFQTMRKKEQVPNSKVSLSRQTTFKAQLARMDCILVADLIPGATTLTALELSSSGVVNHNIPQNWSVSLSEISVDTLPVFSSPEAAIQKVESENVLTITGLGLRKDDRHSPKGFVKDVAAELSLDQIFCILMSSIPVFKIAMLFKSSVSRDEIIRRKQESMTRPFPLAGTVIEIPVVTVRVILPEDVKVTGGFYKVEAILFSKTHFSVTAKDVYGDVFHPHHDRFERFVYLDTLNLDLTLRSFGPKVGQPQAVSVQGGILSLTVPQGYALANVFDNFINLSRGLKNVAVDYFGFVPSPYCAQGNTTLDPEEIYDINVAVNEIVVFVEDDPFESKLAAAYDLGFSENLTRLSREKAFVRTAKQRGWRPSVLFLNTVNAESELNHAWTLLQEFNSKSFLDAAKKSERQIAPPLVKAVFKNVKVRAFYPELMAKTVEETLTAIDPVTSPITVYEELIARQIELSIKAVSIQLRDYPHPLVKLPESDAPGWVSRGLLIIADNKATDESRKEISMSLGKYSKELLNITRSVNPPKIYMQSQTTITTQETLSLSYGASIEPCMADMVNVVDTFTKPSIDPSPPVAWWDKLRLMFHGKNTVELSGRGEAKLRVLGSFSPYFNRSKHFGDDGIEVSFSRGISIALGSNIPGEEVVITTGQLVFSIPKSFSLEETSESRTDEVIVRFTGGVRIAVGLEFKTFSPDNSARETQPWKNHTEITMRNPKYCPRPGVNEGRWDAWHGFRSSSVHVCFALKSPQPYYAGLVDPANVIFTSLESINRLRIVSSIYQSVMTNVPVRRGNLFNPNLVFEAKPKLGKMIGSVRLKWEMSPLYLTVLCESEDSVAGVGIRCRADRMEMDMLLRQHHKRQLQESDDEVNRKPVSKWNLEESAIRFISIEGRMLCYGDAVPGFESCRDNGSLNEEDVWHLSEDVFYTGGECAFELVPCVWAPQLTYFRRHESVNGLPPQNPIKVQQHLLSDRLQQIEIAIWNCRQAQQAITKHESVSPGQILFQTTSALEILEEKKKVLKERIESSKATQRNSTTAVSSSLHGFEPTSPQSPDNRGSFFDHHYIIHNVRLLWNIPVRNAIFRMLDLQTRNWGLAYCLTHTAANIVAQVVDSVSERHAIGSTGGPRISSISNSKSTPTTGKREGRGRSSIGQEMLEMLLTDYANGRRLVVPCETEAEDAPGMSFTTTHSPKLHDLPSLSSLHTSSGAYISSSDPESPNFVTPSQIVQSDSIVTFVHPQVIFELSNHSDSSQYEALVVAADDIQLQTVMILDRESQVNSEIGMNHALIKSRMTVSLNNAQFFTAESTDTHEDENNLALLNSFLSDNENPVQSWPPWVPLECLIDHSSYSGNLNRIMEHVNLSFYRDKMNPLFVKQAEGKNKQEESDQYHLQFPQFIISVTSAQYEIVMDVISNLLVYRDPSRGKRNERLRNLLLALGQVEDLQQLESTVLNLQLKVRQADLLLKSWKEKDVQTYGSKLQVKRMRKDYADELYVIMEALKSLESIEQKRGSISVAFRLFVYTKRIEWIMLDSSHSQVFRWSLGNPFFMLVQNEDQSSVNSLEIETMHVDYLMPNSPFKDMLGAYVTDRKDVDFSRTKMLRLYWRELAPVGGIQVVDHFEINMFPMSIQMTYDMGKQLMQYFFPHRKGLVVNPSASEGDRSNLISPSASESLKSKSHEEPSTSTSMRFKVKDLTAHSRASSDREVNEVKQMQVRASQVKSFIYIKVPGVRHRLSYRGSKEKNFEDLNMFAFHLPALEYRNKTWTWYDLVNAVKKDALRAALANTGALVREKLFQRRRSLSHDDQNLHDTKSHSLQAPNTSSESHSKDDTASQGGSFGKRSGNILKNLMRRREISVSSTESDLPSHGQIMSSEMVTSAGLNDMGAELGLEKTDTIHSSHTGNSVKTHDTHELLNIEKNGRILFGKYYM